MIENKYGCSKAIWKKFSDEEKLKYNNVRKTLSWKDLYHSKIKEEPNIIDVTAHNIACQLVWMDVLK
jgi:hypothetical protein